MKWISTGSDHEDQIQQMPRSSYLVVTHKIDNLPNSHIQKKVKVNVLDQLLFTMQYNHGMVIVTKV